MRILVGYEKSGMIREALRRHGYDAWSCDLQSSDDNSPFHIVADIWDVAIRSWDMGIFHPMCTYLTVSAAWAFKDGPYHQKVKPGTLTGKKRRDAREREIENFIQLDRLPYPTILENPGSSFISTMYRKPDQIIQPNQFGDDASKATGLWRSSEFGDLTPTKHVAPRMVNGRPRWSNQTDSGQNNVTPSDDRWNQRSKTYPGIANAIAAQMPKQISNPSQPRMAV